MGVADHRLSVVPHDGNEEHHGGNELKNTTDSAAHRAPRVGNSVLWALGITVSLLITAMLSQIGFRGGLVAAFVVIAIIGVAAFLVGSVWQRAGAATLAAVFGGASLFFAGPTVYEAYMQSVGEPARVSVVKVSDVEGETRECLVVELDGERAAHRLGQVQNCFDHVRQGDVVTIHRDPLGVLLPRLDDPPGGTGVATMTLVSAGLLGLAFGSVLYGGLRRRDPSEHRPATAVSGAKPMRNVVWLDKKTGAKRTRPRPDTTMPVVKTISAQGVTTVVGYAERAGYGLVLWRDPERTGTFVRIAATSDSTRRNSHFLVTDDREQPIATISRRRAGWLPIRRTRWTIRQEGRPEAVGYKGGLGWWLVWWLTLPLQLVFVPVSFITALAALLFAGDVMEPVRTPLRTKWRVDGQIVLEYQATRKADASGHLQLVATWWDPRLTAALTALIRRYDGWLGDRWGGRKPGRPTSATTDSRVRALHRSGIGEGSVPPSAP